MLRTFFSRPVGLYAIIALRLGPPVKRRALSCVVESRNAIAAAGLDEFHVKLDDLPRPGRRYAVEVLARAGGANTLPCPVVHASLAIEAQDQGSALEGAEHDRRPAPGPSRCAAVSLPLPVLSR